MKTKTFLSLLLCLFAVTQGYAQDKATKQALANTASAVAEEYLYYINADSIKSDKEISLAHATFRYMLKQKDMQSREWQIGFQNKIAYKLLVGQCHYLIEDLNEMMDNARRHPEHMAMCITAGTDMLMQFYGIVRTVVVVAMNSKVPLPWKVDYEKFLNGEDNTPIYANDPDRKEEETDKANLLLPSERYTILNQAFTQIMNLRIAIQAVNYKLKVDLTWQKALETALLFDDQIKEAQRIAFTTIEASLNDRPVP